ncbi:RICIN domain-containing protein, partial [Bacillus cereus]|nr:RICIN domain-containing protein [Bacillus cereus]
MLHFSRKHLLSKLSSNVYYKIENRSNRKVAAISGGSENNHNMFTYPKLDNTVDQEWIYFPIDGEKFIIANRSNGKVAAISAHAKDPNNMFVYDYLPETPDQQWSIETVADNYYKMRNSFNGKVATISGDAKDTNNMFIYDNIPSSSDQQWTPLVVGSFTLPVSPELEELDEAPQYKSANDNLPESTPKRLTAWTLVPCIMVNDNSWSDATKINTSPYYILEKYQYWKRIENLSLVPGEKTSSSYTYGTTTHVQKSLEHTLGFTIGRDSGMNFSEGGMGITKDLKMQFHDELRMSISSSTEDMTSTTQTHDQENPFNTTLTYA